MAKHITSLLLLLAPCVHAEVTVLVFGDSYGDTGPTWKQVRDMFENHNIKATVKSSAIGGSAACQWAASDDGMAVVNEAKKLFPDATDGPDFVWYTMGANDNWQDGKFQSCLREAKGQSFDTALACVPPFNERVTACSVKMLTNYFKAFPKSKVMQSGYDQPCFNALCQVTFDAVFYGAYCPTNNLTCEATLGDHWLSMYLAGLEETFPQPQYDYTTLRMTGTGQVAWGVPGAEIGKPVISDGTNCEWNTLCVHPTYDSPAGKLWGETFWNLYFSKHVTQSNSSIEV